MTLLFWLDVGAYILSAVLALALTLFALGSEPRRRLSQLFALYALSMAGFAGLAAVLRVSLWLGIGKPELLGQLATWAFTLSGPALLLFAAHCVGLTTRRVVIAALVGILWCCVFVLPMVLLGRLVYGHSLDANGTTHVQLTVLGVLSSIVPIAYLIWSLVLLWIHRRRVRDLYMALSTVALLVGLLGGVLLDVSIPLLSFASLVTLAILGHGVLAVQLFNPLRERNVALQLEIAERRRAEGEILRLQHLLQAIANSMPSALITLDLQGRVLTWNPAAELLTGKPAAAVLGLPCREASDDIRQYWDLVQTAIATGEPARRSRDLVEVRGQRRYFDAEVFPLVSNGLTGVVLRIEDVTRRVHFELMTLQSVKMVSVGRLAAGLAHELNNPLGAVMQGVQMLAVMLDAGRESTRARMADAGVDAQALARYLVARAMPSYLDEIHLAGERASGIVTDLLEFSQRSEFELRPHDLNGLVETTLDLAAADYNLRKQYDFREIEVVRELAPDLPPVLCDAPQIQQAILNLVQNAGQAMAAGAVAAQAAAGSTTMAETYRPRLVLQTRLVGEAVRLSIADNGPGLHPAVRDHVFEPFATTRDVGEGTGLGLWLCWSIVVEHHDGRIWAEQVEDGGTRIVMELPVDDGE